MSEWQPIETAPKDDQPDDETGLSPQILLGCFHRGQLLWAMAARYGTAMYGYVHCASRSGWLAEYMPPMASGSDRPRHPGSWIMGQSEFAPTHWSRIETSICPASDAERLKPVLDQQDATEGTPKRAASIPRGHHHE